MQVDITSEKQENNIQIEITEDQNGMRLDKAITDLTSLSRNHVGQLFDNNLIQQISVDNESDINSLSALSAKNFNPNKKIKPSQIAITGQNFLIILPQDNIKENNSNFSSSLDAASLDVVFEDGHLLVVNKPYGQVVHPAPGHPDGTLYDHLLAYFQSKGEKMNTFSGKPAIVHRLDKDTSGLMIIAKSDNVHNALQSQFASRKITKINA